jgi:hypothetical protein
MTAIGRAELVARGLGAIVALGAARTALPGMVSAVGERGPTRGAPSSCSRRCG